MFGIFPATKAKELQKFLIIFFLLVFRIAYIQAQESVLSKSTAFFNLLKQNNINCEKQPLIAFDTSEFPFNITVVIPASTDGKNDLHNDQDRNHLIFSFTQNFAIKNSNRIIEFINALYEKKLPYETEVFFSVNDDTPLSTSDEQLDNGGTAFFISNYVNSDTSFAIVVEEDFQQAIEIISGNSDIAPLWLVKSIREACIEKSDKKIISSSFFIFYSNGFFKENKRVSSYLKEHIPAVSISSDGEQETFDILLCAAEKFGLQNKNKWERHYSFFSFGKKTLSLNENLFSTFYIILAFIIFLVLCFLTFRGSDKFRIRINAVLRIWYIIPEFIILNFFITYSSSHIFALFSIPPEYLFSLEFLTSIFLPVLLIYFQTKNSIQNHFFAIGIIMLLSGIINVFIFANFDISLIVLFFIEYIILLYSAYINTPLLLILMLFLQLIPFVPYTINFLNFASSEGIYKILSPDLLELFVFSSIVFPIQLQIIRILISIRTFTKKTILFLRHRINTQYFITILFLIFCVYFVFSFSLLFKNCYSNTKKQDISIKELPADHITYNLKESPFMDLSNRRLYLTSTIDVLRYVVTIEQNDSVPLYDSNFPYTLSNPHTANLSLPDNPGRNIEIIFVTDSSSQNIITIDAYYLLDQNTAAKETIAFITDSENNISKDK